MPSLRTLARRPERKVFGVDAGYTFGTGWGPSAPGKCFIDVYQEHVSISLDAAITADWTGNNNYILNPMIVMPDDVLTGVGITSFTSVVFVVHGATGKSYIGAMSVIACASGFGFGNASVRLSTNNPPLAAAQAVSGDAPSLTMLRSLDGPGNRYSFGNTMVVPRVLP